MKYVIIAETANVLKSKLRRYQQGPEKLHSSEYEVDNVFMIKTRAQGHVERIIEN